MCALLVICVCGLFFLEPGFEQFKVSERSHGNWIRLYLEENNSEVLFNLGARVRRQYLDALRTLRLSLSKRAAQYDVYSMAVGTVLVLEVWSPGRTLSGQHRPRLVVKGRRDWVFLSGDGSASCLCGHGHPPSLFQVLALLLLSVPQALGSRAELDISLLSPVCSLLFYLLLLALAALHVAVCTAADSSCYLCSLPWLAAGGAMALTAALLCAVVSALTRTFAGGKCLSQVGLAFQMGCSCCSTDEMWVKPQVCSRHGAGGS